MMESMIVTLWVVVFTGMVLAPFPRIRILLAATLGAWLATVILTAITDPTPWGMDPAAAMLISLFAVPLAGRLAGTLAHRVLIGSYEDASNPDGIDGFDVLAGRALARRD
jgi:hypothetical protein